MVSNDTMNLSRFDAPDIMDYATVGEEMIAQLKHKLQSCVSNKDKITVLSVLPSSWSIFKITKEFNVSKHLVKKTKVLVAEQGILCSPKPKPRYETPEETVIRVINFYLDPEISREMPGRKDYKSVLVDGKREHRQKRLVLGNLKEIFEVFREQFPNDKISFSKFAELRPKQCVLAGSSGTHTVCVCCIHENFNLMLTGAALLPMEFKTNTLEKFSDVLSAIKCTPPTDSCHERLCSDCSDITDFKDMILDKLESDDIENITFNQWINVDRCSLDTIIKPVNQFVDVLMEKLEQLSPHHHISKQQADYFRQVKTKADIGEIIIVADFSENYSFVLQNSIQGVHWNNTQATIHPFCCYIGGKESELLSYVIISDDLEHNTAAVNYFQKLLINFLKHKIPDLKKVIYFSDGAAAQYKNKYNILNLSLHEDDFGVPAEWHYFATSHGKGPSDGLGGTIKRLAARASLQLPPGEQLQTPFQLFEWAQQNISGMNIGFAPKDAIAAHRSKLSNRFKSALPIKGIRGFHSCIPQPNGFVEMKIHSHHADAILFNVTEMYNWAKLQSEAEPMSTRSSTKGFSQPKIEATKRRKTNEF